LWLNRELLFSRPPTAAGWLAFPYFLLFEWLSPLFELTGYIVLVWLFAIGELRADMALLLPAIAVCFGVLLSTVALLLEELSFHIYPRKRDLLILFAFGVLENFGYRQITLIWRVIGTWQWLRGKRGNWGVMRRRNMEKRTP